MASIVSTGIGSGLDVAGIVQQLVAAEAAPVERRLGLQEIKAQSRLSGFGSLKAALADFRDRVEGMKSLDTFLLRKASSENKDIFDVSVSKTALPASYAIEVVQLAQAQKLNSGAFTDADTAVGTGTLMITVGASSFSVEITDDNNTLAGIRDAINAAGDNAGVAATIVNADSGSYMIMSGEATGISNNMVITQSGGDGGLSAIEFDPVNGLNSMSESIAAQDALIRIDGFDVVSGTNTVAGAIQGVTINLRAADPGDTIELLVENDEEGVRKTIDEFVESYNELLDVMDTLTSFDAEAELAGPLLGDASIRSIREQVRREFSRNVADLDAPFSSLAEIGIEMQLDGKLSVTDEDISPVLAEDFAKLGQLFSSSDGYATRLFTLVDGFLSNEGIIEIRTSGLNSTIEGLSEQQIALNERLALLETRLLRQFNALDSLISRLTSTSSFLSQQLSNLPGITRPSDR
jgi:flagellar hook-associated protein 2